jgi:hypothetical protein
MHTGGDEKEKENRREKRRETGFIHLLIFFFLSVGVNFS